MEKTGNDSTVEGAMKRCALLIEMINSLSSDSILPSCKRTLLRLANAELTFLHRRASDANLDGSPLSMNIGHLEAVLHVLDWPFVSAVSRVCKPIPFVLVTTKAKGDLSNQTNVHVDVVCSLRGRPAWIVVSDRNPIYVLWDGSERHKGLKQRIEEVLAAARLSRMLRPASVVLFFSRGITESILEKISNDFGASKVGLEMNLPLLQFDFKEELQGEWINILARNYGSPVALEIKLDQSHEGSAQSVCSPNGATMDFSVKTTATNPAASFDGLVAGFKAPPNSKDEAIVNMSGGDIVNFDTTALIAMVSGISNGDARRLLTAAPIDLRQRFKGNVDFVIGQANSEVCRPILAELGSFIYGKKGMICRSVLSEFKELIHMCGGPKEKQRAELLLQKLHIVPDSPSSRVMDLPTTRKLAQKNKIVFGTGDKWHAPTLTANMSFIRAVAQTGMSLYTIEHRPRALTGD
ncbi:hypothetical protein MLD38_032883 [Melastoma candidum]|uniref:Uncharacterized protein n=1 Tax=Melastoma candidum TaxID=119954 RepID=A0ACB9M686_9MYRT|nr:hypothetical protein MLD38_032883 [Melastoma candidum]